MKKRTIFFWVFTLACISILVSSVILINNNGMDQRLQGWVNLLWIPLFVVLLILDSFAVRKFGVKKVNIVELYFLGSLILFLIINWIRLQIQ